MGLIKIIVDSSSVNTSSLNNGSALRSGGGGVVPLAVSRLLLRGIFVTWISRKDNGFRDWESPSRAQTAPQVA